MLKKRFAEFHKRKLVTRQLSNEDMTTQGHQVDENDIEDQKYFVPDVKYSSK